MNWQWNNDQLSLSEKEERVGSILKTTKQILIHCSAIVANKMLYVVSRVLWQALSK